MCGIVGYIGNRPAIDVLIQGLRRLEYRGYDSAGVAFFNEGKVEIRKAEGRLENVENLLHSKSAGNEKSITCGIGHTRWATHGKPTTLNAHPHQTGHVILVHNGIIENYQDIREELLARGHRPKSETDSELFGFLVLEEMDRGAPLLEAVRESFRKVRGQCSVVVVSEREPGVIVGVRNGSPMAAAVDPKGGALIASDAQPLVEYTRDVYFLEHGDMVRATPKGLEFFTLENSSPVKRDPTRLDWTLEKLDKAGFAHYMLKEIHEQPTALVDTINGALDRSVAGAFALANPVGTEILEKARQIRIIACGTSWHSALLGKYWLERWARIPTEVDLASEFRYRSPIVDPQTVLIAISQSGETADTLAVVRQMREAGIPRVAITNVRGSSLSREADAAFHTCAGPEIGVAATKSFLTQLEVLLLIAGHLSTKRNAAKGEALHQLFDQMVKLPHLLAECLEPQGNLTTSIRAIARELTQGKTRPAPRGFFFIGRGYSFPIALEGALKLKEIAYVHAEGYAAGELKHGPIAMIDEEMAVIVLAPHDTWRDKTVSNLEEVKARGAIIVCAGDGKDQSLRSLCDHWIALPEGVRELDESLLPFVLVPIVQLLSYELAVLRGTDVDKPRNLAKSVTVE